MTVQDPRGLPDRLAAGGQVVTLLDRLPSRSAEPLRIALVGTYAPRKCGIATFTADVTEQLALYHPEIAVDIYALDNPADPLTYTGVAGVLPFDDREAYVRAARQINESGVDSVWIQHEYGVFGGIDGEFVCDFVDRIAAPLVFTFHTVLIEPSQRQHKILTHLASRASRIMVMSEHGRDLLASRYQVDRAIIEVISHGAPDRPFGREAQFREALGLADRNVLTTFGLLGPGKGLERVIEALPQVVARHPDTIYRIVGATHPNLVARHGESYREGLKALAAKLGVEDHVVWDDRFLDTPELLDQLEACDIYLTPYPNLQQSTSGTLSYAVALGKAVVSTPYVHARELLADGVGLLVEPDSSDALALAINRLLDDPALLARTKLRAYERGRATIWPKFAAATARLVRSAISPQYRETPILALPGLSGVFGMCDATGMLQHAIGIIPDRRHGYCLDDNVRALMLMNLAQGISSDERLKWSMVYASFIQHAWNPEARRFRNFMNFERTWCEDIGSDDSNGRCLWALGHTVENAPNFDIRRWARQWFDEAHGAFDEIDSPRAVGFAMLGAAAIQRATGGHAGAETLLDRGGALLNGLLARSRRPDWAWFEAVLGYDNPRLPQALIEAGSLRQRTEWVTAGLETLEWIADRQIASSGNFRPVGSESFGIEHAQLPFDQQPLEAQAAVEAARSAHLQTGAQRWVDHALAAYRWYFGANDRGVVLADIASGRCRDGVTPRGANVNCGAESILAFQLAHVSMVSMAPTILPDLSIGDTIEPRNRNLGHSTTHT